MTGVVEPLIASGSAAASAAPYITAAAAVAGAGLQFMGAQRQAAVYRSQARQSDFQARQEELRGREQANQVQSALQRVRAAQNARYAAAGVLLDDGTPETVAAATEAEAERQTTIVRSNATIAAEDRRIRSGMLNDTADATMTNAWWQGGMSLFDLVDRNLQRMPGTTTWRAAAAPAGNIHTMDNWQFN